MIKRAFLLTLLFLFDIPLATAQFDNATLAKIKQQSLSDNFAYLKTEQVSTQFGGRMPATETAEKTIKWLLKELSNYPELVIKTQNTRARNWHSKNARVEILSPYHHNLNTVSLAGSISTPKQGITADVIKINSLEHLQSIDAKEVHNKIVYIARKLAKKEPLKDYYQAALLRQTSVSLAAKKGALAIIQRSISTRQSKLPHTGSISYAKDTPKIPAAAISTSDADLLDRILSRNQKTQVKLTLDNSENAWLPTHNILAQLNSPKPSSENIVIVTHLDSWDLGTGALDNATGVGTMLASLNQLVQLQKHLTRNVIFVFIGSSRLGPQGINHFIKNNPDLLAQTQLATELDMGAGAIIRMDSKLDSNYLSSADRLHTLLADLNIQRGHNQTLGGSQTNHLIKKGIPVISWVQQPDQFFQYLHSADDTFDKIQLTDTQQITAALTAFIYITASSDIRFR